MAQCETTNNPREPKFEEHAEGESASYSGTFSFSYPDTRRNGSPSNSRPPLNRRRPVRILGFMNELVNNRALTLESDTFPDKNTKSSNTPAFSRVKVSTPSSHSQADLPTPLKSSRDPLSHGMGWLIESGRKARNLIRKQEQDELHSSVTRASNETPVKAPSVLLTPQHNNYNGVNDKQNDHVPKNEKPLECMQDQNVPKVNSTYTHHSNISTVQSLSHISVSFNQEVPYLGRAKLLKPITEQVSNHNNRVLQNTNFKHGTGQPHLTGPYRTPKNVLNLIEDQENICEPRYLKAKDCDLGVKPLNDHYHTPQHLQNVVGSKEKDCKPSELKPKDLHVIDLTVKPSSDLNRGSVKDDRSCTKSSQSSRDVNSDDEDKNSDDSGETEQPLNLTTHSKQTSTDHHSRTLVNPSLPPLDTKPEKFSSMSQVQSLSLDAPALVPAPKFVEMPPPGLPVKSEYMLKAQADSASTLRQSKPLIVNGKQYTILTQLGKGGSSVVYQVMDKLTGTQLAVKVVKLAGVDMKTAEGYINEIEVLKKLQKCESVIRLLEYEFVKKSQVLLVVMEKGDIDFANLLRDISKTKKASMLMICYYWSEMVNAVKSIHENAIIHSDLKPANFLLVSGRLKLIDFGIASSLNVDMTSIVKDSIVGTFNYMSPEAIGADMGRANGMKISFKSDVWSLGCILYNLVYGRTPFANILHSMAKLVCINDPNHVIEFPEVPDCPKVLMMTMKRCLMYDPRDRPSTTELTQPPYLLKIQDNVDEFP